MKIRINHPDNFYNGKEGEILDSREMAGVTVHWVKIKSGTASIEFALRDEFVEKLSEKA